MSGLGVAIWLLAVGAVGVAGATCARAVLGSREEGWLGAFAVWSLATLTLLPALLARLGALSTGPLVVTGVVVAVLAVLVTLRARGRNRDLRWGRILALCAVVVALVVPQLASIAARPDSVPVGTPWYFWYLTQEYAEQGAVPSTSEEFGTETTALADYTGYSAGTAMLALVAGGPDGIHAAQVMRAVGVLGAALGFLLLARAWGASLVSAVAGTAVLLSLAYFAGKLSSYRPEGFGYSLLFLLPAVALVYLRTRERGLLVLLGIGVATLSQIHGISFSVAGVLLAGTLATRLVPVLRDRWRELRGLVAPIGVILAGWWGADLVLSGRLTQGGKATSVPRVSEAGDDPTLAFMQAVRAEPGDTFPTSGAELAENVLRTGLYLHRAVWSVDLYFLVVAIAVLAVVVALVTRTRGVPTLLAFAGVSVAIVVAVCFAFQLGWETYVPRRTGWGRFLGQALLFVPLLGAAAIGLGRGARWARLLAAAWIVVAVLAYATTAVPIYRIHESQPSAATMSALRGLELPADAVLTTNAYSEGFVAAVLHREAVTNGRGPYHQAELLETAVDQLHAARAFFAAPAAHAAYLRDRGITHVLVGTEPYLFGTTQLYETDLEALAALETLTPVADGSGFVVFEVAAPATPAPVGTSDPSGAL